MSTSVIKALPGKLDIKRHSSCILYISSNLRMSTSIFKALPGKLDTKRYSSSVLSVLVKIGLKTRDHLHLFLCLSHYKMRIVSQLRYHL